MSVRSAIARDSSFRLTLRTGALAILAIGFVTHGLLLFTDYVLWDGWWVNVDLASPAGRACLKRLLHEVGRPADYLFYLPFGMAEAFATKVFMAKAAGVAVWISASLAVFYCMVKTARLPLGVAFALASLTVTSTAFPLLGEMSLFMNSTCVMLFWVAWALATWSDELAGPGRTLGTCASCALLFLSFNLNSNLVLFYATALTIVGLRLPDAKASTVQGLLSKIDVRHVVALVLPVVFWVLKSRFTPTHGFYATGYNRPSLDVARMVTGYYGVLVDFVARGTMELFSSAQWVVASTVVGFVLAARLSGESAEGTPHGDRRTLGLRLLVFGTGLLIAAAFPYLAVGQPLANQGWVSRNCILCPLPIAMIVVGGLMTLNTWLVSRIRWVWVVGVVVCSLLGIRGCIHNYLVYQAFGVKQWSIRNELLKFNAEKDASVVQLRDYVWIPGAIGYYPPIVWTYMASDLRSAPRVFVVETAVIAPDQIQAGTDGARQRVIPQIPLDSKSVDEAITATTMPYALTDIPRTGRHWLVAAYPNRDVSSPAAIGWQYLVQSWLTPREAATCVRMFTKCETFTLPDVR